MKKPVGLLIWMLCAVALVGVIFMFWPQKDDSIRFRIKKKISQTDQATINSYLDWAMNAETDSMEQSHSFISNGIVKLANALKVLSKYYGIKNKDRLKGQLASIKTYANSIKINSTSLAHANTIKKSFLIVSEVIDDLQPYAFSERGQEIDKLHQNISEIDADKPTLAQKKSIFAVLKQAAQVLKPKK